MSIYESLEGFVGAVVIAAAPALDVVLSNDQLADPARFAHGLRQSPLASRFGALLDNLAYDVWTSQESRGFSMALCEAHARALTEIVSQLEAPKALVQTCSTPRSASESDDPGGDGFAIAQTIANDLLESALEDTSFASGDIRYDVAAFLIERAFARVLEDKGLLPALLAVANGESQTSSSQLPFPSELRRLPALRRSQDGQGSDAVAPPLSMAPGPSMTGATARPHGDIAAPSSPASSADADFLESLGDRYGLTEKALAAISTILSMQSLPHAERLSRLEDFAAWMCTTLEYLGKPTNDEAEVRRLKGLAASALAAGSFAEAMEHLKHLRREVREGRRRIEMRLQEELRSLEIQMGEEARAIARMAELAMARLDFDAAADLFAEAADSTPERDRKGRWRHLMRQGEALLRKGEDHGDQAALRSALDVYQQALTVAGDIGNPNAGATAHLGCGTAHLFMASDDAASSHVDAAIESLEAARAGFSRKEEPRRLAQATLRLGNALMRKGQSVGDTAVYVRAASAFREGLSLLSLDESPHDWAAAHTGLGRALLAQADERPSRSTLAEAEAALAEALRVLTPANARSAWMEAASAHATALLELAEGAAADDGAPGKAVAAFERLLEHCDPSWQRQDWAEAKLGYANALAIAATRQTIGTDGYLAAIDAYDEALAHIDATEDPLTWAITQINRGSVLIKLGEHRDKRRLWMAAASAMVPALEIFERHGESQYVDIARRNLKKLHQQWDEIIGPLRATGSS